MSKNKFALIFACIIFLFTLNTKSYAIFEAPNQVVIPVFPSDTDKKDSLQLKTFPFITLTPTMIPSSIPTSTFTPIVSTSTPAQSATTQPAQPVPGSKPIPVTTPIIGGPTSGMYCIDDVDPDMCDDNSSYLVPYGSGGSASSCGTVIEQAHKLVKSLPQYMKGTRDALNPAVSSSCASTGPYSSPDYIQSYFVIDAYNLAGFSELKKTDPNNVSPSGLFNWWSAQPSGYKFIPYSTTVVQDFSSGKQDLTGCVMFLQLGSGSYHIGIVNKLEVFSAGGDGVISILQSGTSMYIDRFPVKSWAIENTSTNQTSTSGVKGFGCHI